MSGSKLSWAILVEERDDFLETPHRLVGRVVGEMLHVPPCPFPRSQGLAGGASLVSVVAVGKRPADGNEGTYLPAFQHLVEIALPDRVGDAEIAWFAKGGRRSRWARRAWIRCGREVG